VGSIKEKVFVFGAGGHASVVIDALDRQGHYEISCILDDDTTLHGTTFCNYPVVGGRKTLLLDILPGKGIVAVGDNAIRCAVGSLLEEHHYGLVTVIHPSAQIGRDVTIGSGTVVMANAVVNPSTVIGRQVIVNTGVVIEHDCVIGTGTHIAPGTVLCGGVRIGDGSFLGAGSTVIQNIEIGDRVMVAAGTTVYHHQEDEARCMGPR